VKKVLVKAYNSISKVKRYYILLRRLYKILQDKLQDKKLNKEIILQIVIKAINNIIRPDKLMPTLLVFGLYFKIID
jgi:accessory gene regulator protein AgrB